MPSEAVQRQMARATHPGACHELEVEWGQWVQRLVPSAEKLFSVSSSGTVIPSVRHCAAMRRTNEGSSSMSARSFAPLSQL